jgi:tetratricopeptide (TPR) repeat protein
LYWKIEESVILEAQPYMDEAKRKEKQGLWEEALLEYEKARVLDPDNKDILLSLSRIYLFRNKPIQSLEVLHAAHHLKNDADFSLTTFQHLYGAQSLR